MRIRNLQHLIEVVVDCGDAPFLVVRDEQGASWCWIARRLRQVVPPCSPPTGYRATARPIWPYHGKQRTWTLPDRLAGPDGKTRCARDRTRWSQSKHVPDAGTERQHAVFGTFCQNQAFLLVTYVHSNTSSAIVR